MEKSENSLFHSDGPEVEAITPTDIKPPLVFKDDESVIVFGINASDRANRKLPKESPQFGALDEGQAEATEVQYKNFFDGIFKSLPPEERARVDILIIASNANLRMPGGVDNPHKRSVETSERILAAARASMAEFGVNSDQLLNKTGKPIEVDKLKDLTMWDKAPKFVDFLYEKYGDSKELWAAYEEDRHKDVREYLKNEGQSAEGPDDIADRVGDYMATLKHALDVYHIHHPGRRMVAIVNTQYDAAAPMIKKYILDVPLEQYVPIDKRGGVVLKVNAEGETSATLQGHTYPVSFKKLATDADFLEEEQNYFRLPKSERITPEEMLAKLKNEPLDPVKIEEVVDKFTQKHVQHKNGAIIFVGSGSGKSFAVRQQTPNSEGKTDLVDADFIYRETGAHPLLPTKPGEPLRTFPWWYMGDKVILEVEKRCAMVNEAMVRKGLWALTSSFDPEDSNAPSNTVVALIPWEEHRRNIVEKFRGTKEHGRYYDGGVRATYPGLKIAQSHRAWALKVASEKNIPLFNSIKEAIDYIRSRESMT